LAPPDVVLGARASYNRVVKAPLPRSRSVIVQEGELKVAVEAEDALRQRIAAILGADGVSIASNGGVAPADLRVVGADLSDSGSLRRFKAILSGGAGRVVAVSPPCGTLGLRRAVRAGAVSVVFEHQLEDALVPAVRAVAAGLTVMPADAGHGAGRIAFSHREREVLRLAVTGHTNREIASKLFLAESTIKCHLSSAYRKLGAQGRSDAASMIFDPDEGLADMVLGQDAPNRTAGDGQAA
jgi:DNA-binding NarL/FixJ family response regulator